MVLQRRDFVKLSAMGLLGMTCGMKEALAQKPQRFKVGVAATGWLSQNQSLEGYWYAAEAIAQLGIGATEADNMHTQFDVAYGSNPSEFIARSKKTGVQLEGIYQALPLHETSKWNEMMSKIRSDGKFLKTVGAKYIAFGWLPPAPVGGKPYVRTQDDVKQSIKVADELGRVLLEEHGMPLAFHAERDIPKEMVLQILDGTNPKYVKLCADVGHLTGMGLDALQVVKKYYSRLVASHFKDFDPKLPGRVRPGNFVEVGTGVVDFHGIVAFYREMGFDGWVMLELDRTRLASVEESVTQQKKYLMDELKLQFVPKGS